MRTALLLLGTSVSSSTAAITSNSTTSLAELCTTANIQAALPSNGSLLGINLLSTSVTAAVANASGNGMSGPGASTASSSTSLQYCNVTVQYTHTGKNDRVALRLAFPAPSAFKKRFYAAGGGGYSLSSSATGGLQYGAAGAATDAGYNGFTTSFDAVIVAGNGSVNWDATHMFAYQALGEMTQVGKAVTRSLYRLPSASKLYTYFEGCSDGGRQAMSQVQRYGTEYDGVVAGAPAFRFAQQQVNHVFPAVMEQTLGYLPPPCELARIVNATIAACDPLDGRTDGVVSRTDLCQLHFNWTSLEGLAYSCAAQTSTSLGFGFSGGGPGKVKRQMGAPGSSTSYQPAQNGTVTKQGIAVAKAIYNGLHNSQGQRAYLSWQIASELSDAAAVYDNTTAKWKLSIPSTGGEYVTKFIQLQNVSNLGSVENVTDDMLVAWMKTGLYRYLDTLQTTLPDLTEFHRAGGKLLHYHGESDPSVPAASSVHYWQSVRSIMYGNISASESLAQLQKWYQLYLVPGAAHCGANSLQPGPYPQTNMQTLIDWVESGKQPARLNASVSSGTFKGETQQLCQWPTRPLWTAANSSAASNSSFTCTTDEASIASWTYTFPAFNLPIY